MVSIIIGGKTKSPVGEWERNVSFAERKNGGIAESGF